MTKPTQTVTRIACPWNLIFDSQHNQGNQGILGTMALKATTVQRLFYDEANDLGRRSASLGTVLGYG